MNSEDPRILGCDGIITGCSGAIIGAVVGPFLLLAFLANAKPTGDFGPLAGIIILLFFVCIGALIGGILGNILNKLIKKIMNR